MPYRYPVDSIDSGIYSLMSRWIDLKLPELINPRQEEDIGTIVPMRLIPDTLLSLWWLNSYMIHALHVPG